MIGQETKVTFTLDTHNGRSGLKADAKVGGRYAFPDNRRGGKPQDGEEWRVKVVGQNPAGSVYFLECLERVSTRESRVAAEKAYWKAEEEAANYRCSLIPQINAAVAQLDLLQTKHTIEVDGNVLKVEVGTSVYGTKVTRGGVTHQMIVNVWVGEKPYHDGRGYNPINSVTILVPWDKVQVQQIAVQKDGTLQAEIVTGYHYGWSSVWVTFSDVFPESVKFVDWEFCSTALSAHLDVIFAGVTNRVLAHAVGQIQEQNAQPYVVWANWMGDSYRKDVRWISHFLPEVPQWAKDKFQAQIDAKRAKCEEFRDAGLLSISSSKVWNGLKDAGIRGVGFCGNAADYSKKWLIHPSLRPLVDGLKSWDGEVVLEPFQMDPAHGSNVWEWNTIHWYNGSNSHSPEEIAAMLAETYEEIAVDDLQNGLLQEYGREERQLSARIVCHEIAQGEYYHGQYKFAFDAVVSVPHTKTTFRKNVWGMDPVVIGTEVVWADHTFENVAHGNERFEGESKVSVVQQRIRKVFTWVVCWKAPDTTGEKATLIRALILQCKQYPTILTGWRYTDTGNPVVYVDYGGGSWHPQEFDAQYYNSGKRKGSCSSKGDFYSLGGLPDARQIERALKQYASYGWPVAPDENWRQKAGKPLTSIFPAELVANIQGGV